MNVILTRPVALSPRCTVCFLLPVDFSLDAGRRFAERSCRQRFKLPDALRSAFAAHNNGECTHAVNIKPKKSTGPNSDVPVLFALSQWRYR